VRILLVYNESGVEGKGNIDLFSLYRELKRLGHEPAMIVRKYGEIPSSKIYQVFPEPLKAFFSLPSIMFKTSQIIKKEKPDVIVEEGGWYIPILLSFANRQQIPIIYVFRGLVLEVLVAFHAKSFIIKTVARAFIKINYRIFRRARHLVGTNTSICKFYGDKLGKKVELIGTHLMNLERFRPLELEEREKTRKKFNIGSGLAVLYSGAIEEWHMPYLTNLAESVFSLQRNTDIQLVIMGWGSCRDRFVNYLLEKQRSGFKCVILPFLQHDEVPRVIASCDICVDPLLRPYPMDHAPAGKLMEYMACGACVITTNGYSNEELVQDHFNGIIVNGSREELTDALQNLAQDKQQIRIYGVKAIEKILTYFASINRVEAFEDYLKKVVDNR
jgi:glycosyltransferase involved in cell wall biosynthesis